MLDGTAQHYARAQIKNVGNDENMEQKLCFAQIIVHRCCESKLKLSVRCAGRPPPQIERKLSGFMRGRVCFALYLGLNQINDENGDAAESSAV